MAQGAYFLGIDIGGTFTDLVLAQETSHQVHNAKTLTTPDDPVAGVMNGVREVMAQASASARDIQRVVHATTLATNLILERKGARVGFVTTEGFGDMFQISKQRATGLDRYNLLYVRPPAFVAREMVIEAVERLSAQGEVLVPLDERQAERAVAALAGHHPEAIAVCLLHAYANPVHERALGEMIKRRIPAIYVALSSEVWPEFQEYERAATTLLSAYVGPMMSAYVGRLAQQLGSAGVASPLQIMQSSGAVMTAPMAARKAAYSLESGPAAGVIATAHLGRICNLPNLISFDMGGTTAKVGLVRDGKPTITHNFCVGGAVSSGARSTGEPIKMPVIDLVEVGAGGGSIAAIDSGGFLQVGPHSAGAAPGPACYGFGGSQATVTDANVMLGYLNPEYFLGGKMKIFPERSREAIEALAARLDLPAVAVAHGIYELANTKMGSALRLITVQRGIDPREFALVAFGGAGPIHVVNVAEQFRIPTIIIPPSPGVASAFGLLVSDVAYDFVTTQIMPATADNIPRIREIFANLERSGREALHAEGIEDKDIVLARTVEVRFVHQQHDLPIAIPNEEITEATIAEAEERFRNRYFELYRVRTADPCRFVNFGVRATGIVPKPQLSTMEAGDGDASRALKGSRKVYFGELREFVDCNVYDRRRLQNADRLSGPAVLEEPDSTTICPAGYSIVVDPFLNVLLQKPQ
ncbi:MAG TPA: hydantoinase/oxoprolinase family protein [Candidatus Binataceae bacterium]|nr:hydantoinase/oxoprolinase family protein [Candidatus Binataceae bacterium]